jgi:hypothetical protein
VHSTAEKIAGNPPFSNSRAKACTVRNAPGNTGRCGEISKGQLCSFLQTMKKSFLKCMGILPLMSCNKTINRIFPRKYGNLWKIPRKYRSVGKLTSISSPTYSCPWFTQQSVVITLS